MHDVEQLVTVSSEFEKAFATEDIQGINKLIKLCERIETSRDSIKASPLNKTLFKIEKAWRTSEVKEREMVSRNMRSLIASWKEKYFAKTSGKKSEQKK